MTDIFDFDVICYCFGFDVNKVNYLKIKKKKIPNLKDFQTFCNVSKHIVK